MNRRRRRNNKLLTFSLFTEATVPEISANIAFGFRARTNHLQRGEYR